MAEYQQRLATTMRVEASAENVSTQCSAMGFAGQLYYISYNSTTHHQWHMIRNANSEWRKLRCCKLLLLLLFLNGGCVHGIRIHGGVCVSVRALVHLNGMAATTMRSKNAKQKLLKCWRESYIVFGACLPRTMTDDGCDDANDYLFIYDYYYHHYVARFVWLLFGCMKHLNGAFMQWR